MKLLIVYGPTREPIDPVRYISNYSTGVMGRYLIEWAKKRKHSVDKIECPIDAETAQELLILMKKKIRQCDALIMAAAVCDTRPVSVAKTKIKKEKLMTLKLVKNPDLLAALIGLRKPGQKVIGFALESENWLQNAAKKIENKKLDLIVLQRVTINNKPFGDKKIDAWFVEGGLKPRVLKGIAKRELAKRVIVETERLLEIA